MYSNDSDKPYTGEVFKNYSTGEKFYQGTYEDGLLINFSYLNKDGSVKEPINYETTLLYKNGVYLSPSRNEPYSGMVFSLNLKGEYKCKGILYDGKILGLWTYFDNNRDSMKSKQYPNEYFRFLEEALEAVEDAVISAIRSGLRQYANNKLYREGKAYWPYNPFDVLTIKPTGYSLDESDADINGEWTFNSSRITYQRSENKRYFWEYDYGTGDVGDYSKIGTLGKRNSILLK